MLQYIQHQKQTCVRHRLRYRSRYRTYAIIQRWIFDTGISYGPLTGVNAYASISPRKRGKGSTRPTPDIDDYRSAFALQKLVCETPDDGLASENPPMTIVKIMQKIEDCIFHSAIADLEVCRT